MNNENIIALLKEKSDNHPEFYERIIPGCKKALGIRVPELRKIAKQIAKEDYKTFLDTFPLDYLESELLYVMVIGYMKAPIDEIIQYFENFIPNVHDWCVNDTLCQGFTIARKYPKEVWSMLMKHKKAKKEFTSRVISVTLLSHYLNDQYIDKVIQVLNQLYIEDYNAKMGVAWAVASILGKYPDKGIAYMQSEENKLDKWTYNKAIQKAIESYVVSEGMKNTLRGMRKK